jgi:hypothetical protein
MTTVNYPQPVQVNGFSCKNCTDVDYANKHIDPQHPSDGPYGVNKVPKPGDLKADARPPGVNGPAVVFAGRLAGLAAPAGPSAPTSPTRALDISV